MAAAKRKIAFGSAFQDEWDWDIYLVDSSGHETVKLDSFYIDDDDGTRVKHFIVPMSNTIQRYKIIVWALQGPNLKKTLGGQATIDGHRDPTVLFRANTMGTVDVAQLGSDYLGFQPVLISDKTDSSLESIKALGDIQLDVWELVQVTDSYYYSGASSRPAEHVLSADSRLVPESKKSKISSVQTVSAGTASSTTRSDYRSTQVLVTLHGRYASADNFFLRHILPEQFWPQITSRGIRREPEEERDDEPTVVELMPMRKEKKPRLSSLGIAATSSSTTTTTTATTTTMTTNATTANQGNGTAHTYKVDDDGVLDLTGD